MNTIFAAISNPSAGLKEDNAPMRSDCYRYSVDWSAVPLDWGMSYTPPKSRFIERLCLRIYGCERLVVTRDFWTEDGELL